MRGPHVTVRGNAKKYYCSPYGSRALSGRERRWKGGENFLEKGGAPTFSPPFHRPPFPPSSKTFDLIESLPPCFPVGKSPSPPTGSRGNDGFIPRRQTPQKQKPPELSSDGFLVLKAIFPTCAGTNSRRAASPPVESLGRGKGEVWRGEGEALLQKGFLPPPPARRISPYQAVQRWRHSGMILPCSLRSVRNLSDSSGLVKVKSER